MDKLYLDYKLTYCKDYIKSAKNRNQLYEAVQGLPFEVIAERKDIIDAFAIKANQLGIDEDKLFSWLEY